VEEEEEEEKKEKEKEEADDTFLGMIFQKRLWK
jgi:hypothetical protein